MDLPTCPACGQSVLDDDAEDCPFCGASMSGKPAKKAPAKKSAKPSGAGTAKSSTTSKPATTKAPPEPEDDDDNPITADKGAAKRAIPLARKPSKGRMHRVVCPMCDTGGFTSTKAAGKEVRCANTDCMVPLFTAPRLEVDDRPVEEPVAKKSGLPVGVLIGVGVVVLAAAGGWGYMTFLVPDIEVIKGPTAEELASLKNLGKKNTTENDTTKPDNSDKKDADAKKDTVIDKGPPQLAPSEIRSQALDKIVEAAIDRSENRSRPFCRRLAAEAYAVAGNIEGANKQLERLKSVGSGLPYFHVTPLVMIAWKQLADGDADSAAATTDLAWSAATRLPNVGRYALDASSELAALLIVVGRKNDARDLVRDHQDPGPLGQISAILTAANAAKHFNLDQEHGRKPLSYWTAPQRVAVTILLTIRGYSDQAVEWATASPDILSQAECLAAWAETLVSTVSQPNQLAVIDEQIASFAPTVKARVYARTAYAQMNSGDQSGAETTLSKAKTTLETIKPAAETFLPGMKELARELPVKPPNPLTMEMAALAAGEIARVEAGLMKQSDAWDSIGLAMKYAKAIGPSLTIVQLFLNDIDQKGTNVIREQVKSILELESDDMARLAFSRYRKQLGLFRDAANQRLQLQVSLLKEAADWGLLDQVAEEVRSQAKVTDDNRREPFSQTGLPMILAARFRKAGAEDEAKAFESAMSETAVNDRYDAIEQSTLQLVEEGKIQEAVTEIEALKADQPGDQVWQLTRMMKLACRLIEAGNVEQGLQFISLFDSQVWHEDGYKVSAALASRKNQGTAVLQFLKEEELTPTERVAIFRGLVAGTMAMEAELNSKLEAESPESDGTEEKSEDSPASQ